MSAASPSPRKPVVIRARSAVVIFVLALVVVAALLVDSVLHGTTAQTLAALPWLALVLWLIYAVLFRPCVVVAPDGLRVRNIFRHHDLPWPSISALDSRFQLTVTLTDGRTIASWGAPTTAVRKVNLRGETRSGASDAIGWVGVRSFLQRPEPSDRTLGRIEDLRAHWAPDAAPADPPASAWEWWSVATALVLAALCALAVVVD